MTAAEGSGGYYLGYSDVEVERLIRQAKRLAPVTEHFLREAGIKAGQRVLDVGSGVWATSRCCSGGWSDLVARWSVSIETRVPWNALGGVSEKQAWRMSDSSRPISRSSPPTSALTPPSGAMSCSSCRIPSRYCDR
jgi:hypothetical protein